MDFSQYIGTGSPSNNQLDPTDQHADYGMSSNDVRHRFVTNIVYQPSFKVNGYAKYVANGWTFAPIFQAQTGLPFTGAVSGNVTGAFGSGPLGTGVNRLPGFRNSFHYPGTFILDTRLSKTIPINEKMNVELIGEAFNLPNHVNYTGVITTMYSASGSTATGIGTLTFNPNNGSFGAYNNANSNFIYNPRQLQIGARFNF